MSAGNADRRLEELAAGLKELGFDTFVKLGEGDAPDQLFVALAADEQDRVLHLQLMWLAGLEEPSVMQLYVGLPTPVAPGAAAELCRFLNAVNAALPIGGFGCLENANLVYFRYNLPAAVDPVDVDLIGWSSTMAEYVVSELGGLVEKAAAGLDFESATGRLAEVLERIDRD